MPLTDLFNPTFFMFLGILLLVVAALVVYFESKAREQNHKISSMLSLVSTLAEDMNGVKMGLNHLAMTTMGTMNNVDHLNTAFISSDNEENKLITVSDDENDSESDEESDEEKEKEERGRRSTRAFRSLSLPLPTTREMERERSIDSNPPLEDENGQRKHRTLLLGWKNANRG